MSLAVCNLKCITTLQERYLESYSEELAEKFIFLSDSNHCAFQLSHQHQIKAVVNAAVRGVGDVVGFQQQILPWVKVHR